MTTLKMPYLLSSPFESGSFLQIGDLVVKFDSIVKARIASSVLTHETGEIQLPLYRAEKILCFERSSNDRGRVTDFALWPPSFMTMAMSARERARSGF